MLWLPEWFTVIEPCTAVDGTVIPGCASYRAQRGISPTGGQTSPWFARLQNTYITRYTTFESNWLAPAHMLQTTSATASLLQTYWYFNNFSWGFMQNKRCIPIRIGNRIVDFQHFALIEYYCDKYFRFPRNFGLRKTIIPASKGSRALRVNCQSCAHRTLRWQLLNVIVRKWLPGNATRNILSLITSWIIKTGIFSFGWWGNVAESGNPISLHRVIWMAAEA